MPLQPLDSASSSPGRHAIHISRCTAAISRFIDRLALPSQSNIDPTAVYALINMVQGRVLEYLAERICRGYDVYDKDAAEKISVQLSSIFSDEFFALFRLKIDRTPNLVLHIAQRIIAKECAVGETGCCNVVYVDRMYSAIFRKYFEYRHLGALLGIMAADARIQRTIVQTLASQKVRDETLREDIDLMLRNDSAGVVPGMMLSYLREGRIGALAQAMRSPEWQARVLEQGARLAHLRGE
ncbi:MAG: hypothetical protein HY342_08895 [Candidatus Lambdaproteobacteria bacterium]|nr:hypothetical protein [Candidatus Lambdaproteobacteria bacterium]